MSRPSPHALRRSTPRSRRRAAGIAVVLGLAVLVPDGAMSTFASEQPTNLSRPLVSDDFAQARRSEPISVAPPPEPPSTLAPPPPLAPPPAVVPETASFEQQVIDLTNAERVGAGVAPLSFHPSLEIAASTHAQDQRNQLCQLGSLTHTGSDGSHGIDRILRTGMDISRWGENIACGHMTPGAVVRGWMASEGHRANILDPRLTHIGVAVASSDTGLLYWVQNFATLR